MNGPGGDRAPEHQCRVIRRGHGLHTMTHDALTAGRVVGEEEIVELIGAKT
ncbi:hypothetical protein ACFWTE_00300 [Nocardiopsis sp. NPDC058631]|uniref:hypothetical protein n=1 Tax=Nocardiopsis sp. NPDC058631 TaxID=3346566 RepID=UPI00365828C6